MPTTTVFSATSPDFVAGAGVAAEVEDREDNFQFSMVELQYCCPPVPAAQHDCDNGTDDDAGQSSLCQAVQDSSSWKLFRPDQPPRDRSVYTQMATAVPWAGLETHACLPALLAGKTHHESAESVFLLHTETVVVAAAAGNAGHIGVVVAGQRPVDRRVMLATAWTAVLAWRPLVAGHRFLQASS